MKREMILLAVGIATSMWGAPILKISPSANFSFGKYPANLEKEHTFILTNSGDGILEIDKVKVTCGCSAAEVEKDKLSAGESSELKAKIRPESIAGPFSKRIFIHSNASNGRIQMVTLSGEAVPLITVAPQNKLYIGTLSVDKSFHQEFILKSTHPII